MLLGFIQGITEFFPISSSGHLVILKQVFGVQSPGVTLEVFLHTGTLLSVIFVFYREIWLLIKGFLNSIGISSELEKKEYKKIFWLVILANIPVGIIGVFFKEYIEMFFKSSGFVFQFLIFTGLYLLLGRLVRKEIAKLKDISVLKSLIIGISQVLAVLPGVSRSGITITTGKLLNIDRNDAARFSFLIMIPAVAGATLMEVLELNLSASQISYMILGMLVSFVTGYIALKILLKIVKNYKFYYFSFYCILVGLTGIIFIG